MKRVLAVGGVAMAIAMTMGALPATAHADDARTSESHKTETTTSATDDTLHLRNGGLYRGRVTEIVPGDHVTITVTGGESKRVAWPEVERVIVASTTLPPPPSSPAPAATLAAMEGPRAFVHLKGSNKAILFRHPAGTTDLVQACEAPCDIEVPLGDSYKIGGPGLSTTSEFRLHASPGGTVELTVDGPSWFGIVGGGLSVIGGGLTLYVGALLGLAGSGCSGCYAAKDVRNVGIALSVVGGAMIGLGLAVVFPSMKTDFSQETSSPPPPKGDAFVRSPVWSTASATSERAPATAPATFPALFERRF